MISQQNDEKRMEPMEIEAPPHAAHVIEVEAENESLLAGTPEKDDEYAYSYKYTKVVASPQRCAPCGIARICGSFMVLIVLGLIGLTYYPMMKIFNDGTISGTIIVGIFNIIAILILVSYLQTVMTDPGTVPDEWAKQAAESNTHTYPVCRKCSIHKPPRSHYDSITQRLVLNMDHYCPWTNNCIGFYNKKFFILFVTYTAIGCLYSVCFLGPYSWNAMEQQKLNHIRNRANSDKEAASLVFALIAAIFDGMFAIVLTLFAIAHIVMASWNQTSIEGSRLAKPFDNGVERNLELVFGKERWAWFLPIYHKGPAGDGVHWQCNDGSWTGYFEDEADTVANA